MISWIIKAAILVTIAIAAGLVSFILMKNFLDVKTAAPVSVGIGIAASLLAFYWMKPSSGTSSSASPSYFYGPSGSTARQAL